MTKLDLSVVIPLLNEVESIYPLYQELNEVLPTLDMNYEIIFVDDGSTDGSFEVIKELHERDRHVKAIQFRRNFGKAEALAAGFDEARGEIIITMDADLQDEPGEIPRFLAKLEEGFDLVSGWKYPRLDPLSKTLPSRVFNRVTGLVTGIRLHDLNCGFKAYRHEVLNDINIYGELHRYIPVLAHWKGYRVEELKIQHRARPFGRSKYGPARFYRSFFDLLTVVFLTQYTRRPLHLFGWLGILCFLAGVLVNGYLTVLWFMGERPIGNRPLLMLGVLLVIVGVQFLSFGLLAEMLASLSAPASRSYSIKQRLE
ncbi:MAG: glycosyltransferase family 2 protein [Anaerolineae bacterium]